MTDDPLTMDDLRKLVASAGGLNRASTTRRTLHALLSNPRWQSLGEIVEAAWPEADELVSDAGESVRRALVALRELLAPDYAVAVHGLCGGDGYRHRYRIERAHR